MGKLTDWDWKEAYKKIPDLPADFREYALDLFDGEHTLYYHGRGVNQTVTCPVCRESTRYNSRTQIFPKSGEIGVCMGCGLRGIYAHALRVTRPDVREAYIFLGQKFGEDGFILRGFKVILIERNPLNIRDMEEEPMELRLIEYRRLFITKEGYMTQFSTPNWECIHRTASGYGICYVEEEENRCWNTIPGDNYKKFYMYLYPGIYEEMQGTAAQYCCMEKLFGKDPEAEISIPVPRYTYGGQTVITVWDYLLSYAKDRKLEILLKCGLENLAIEKLAGSALHYNPKAKNPWDYLKVTKERFKWMCAHNPGTRMFEICKEERRNGLKLDDEICDVLGAAGLNVAEFEYFLRFMSPKQLSNRLLKYTGKKGNMRSTAITYRDYLHMREDLGYDMTNTIYTYPRNLQREHDKLVIEQNERAAEKRRKEVESKYKKIRERFKEAAVVYSFEEKGLLIRPAKNATEIVNEGRKLHHCVGGDRYLKSHGERKTIICFLRHKKTPAVPYITVEVEPTGKIRQWYGTHDTKPDEKKINRFLRDYCNQLDLKALAKEAKVKIAAALEAVAI